MDTKRKDQESHMVRGIGRYFSGNNIGRRTHTSRLKGKYRVRRVLQKAIFGDILLAEATNDDEQMMNTKKTLFVLKAVDKKLAKARTCRRGVKVFENHDLESNILRQIRKCPHPNLLGLAPEEYQVDTSDFKYTALPYAEGGELFAVVDRGGPLGEEDSKIMCRGIVMGLNHLHNRIGYAHNDISLENILLARDGTPWICDYGLAKRIGEKWDVRRCISGKLPYQAPEIYMGTAKESSGKADVFSLGVALFVMICGIPPFDLPDPHGDQRYRYIQMGRMGELLKLWGRSMSEEAIDLLTRMLTHDPNRRISVQEMVEHPWLRSEVSLREELEDDDVMSEDEEEETVYGSRPVPMASTKTPVSNRSFTTGKPSPDSVFSFEDAYRRHAVETSTGR